MRSSVPAALDYLVQQVRLLPECAPPVTVEDGWPATRHTADLVTIGINPEGEDTTIATDYAMLSGEEHETVDVPSLVSCHAAGENAASRARIKAYTILGAIQDLVQRDRTLGGAIVPGTQARLHRVAMEPTWQATQAGEGRWCDLRFWISWQHRG